MHCSPFPRTIPAPNLNPDPNLEEPVVCDGATECMFGQQRDEKKASRMRPNYDLFFFEIETRSGVKMLHEMQATRT